MENENLYINASCSFINHVVIKNNKQVFQNQGLPMQPFLVSVYGYFAIDYPRFYKMDNLCKLGFLATEVLLAGSFDKSRYLPEEIGLVLSNKNSSLDTDLRYYETVKTIASPALFVYTLPNIVLGEISIRHNFKGENDFFIFEQFDAGFLERYVRHLFTTGALKACICGWVEVLEDHYRASLFLIEYQGNGDSVVFTKDSIYNIYHLSHE